MRSWFRQLTVVSIVCFSVASAALAQGTTQTALIPNLVGSLEYCGALPQKHGRNILV